MTLRSDGLFSDTAAVTPSDTAEQNFAGLYIGGTGDVAVKGKGGVSHTFKAVPTGAFIPMNVTAIMLTGTTATNILGLIP